MYLSKNNIYIALLFTLALTSSFDIFMKISVNGFSLRVFYLIELFLLFILLKKIIKGQIQQLSFIGYKFIVIWSLFIIAFIPNTTILSRSIGYALWLVLSVFIILLFSNLVDKKKVFDKLFNLYIFSFLIVAIFGLLQFFLGLLGIDILVAQWWIGKTPRINGFSYEPSYYASYLMIGWSILAYLYFKSNSIFKHYKFSFIIITLSIILSSSRMGILIMIIGFVLLLSDSLIKSIFRYKLKIRDIKFLTFISVIFIVIISLFIIYLEQVRFLIAGLGIFGASAHSSSTRIFDLFDTFQVFLNSPFLGYSLGGVSPAIAELRGNVIYTQLEAKDSEGMSIFFEVLAASGIIGFLFFISFFVWLYYNGFKTIKRLKAIHNTHNIIVGSLSFALFMELFILSLNQNILRPYLWVLIGMYSLSILIGRKIINEHKSNH